MAYRRTGLSVLIFAASGALALACGDDDTTTNPVDAGGSDATVGPDGTAADTGSGSDTGVATDTGPTIDAAVDSGTFDRGPTTLPFSGDPNGLFWDEGVNQALYVSDSLNNAIQKWTDAAGYSVAATLPALDLLPDGGPETPTLGGVLRMLDGTLVVTRFGFGHYGAIIVVPPKGDAGILTGIVDGGVTPLSTKKRRLGIAMLADGTILDTYFTPGLDGGPRVGAVAKVNLIAGTEKDFITGLQKPVGIAQALDGSVLVTDQDQSYMIGSTLNGGVFTDPDAAVDAGDQDAGDLDASDADAATVDAGPPPFVFAGLAGPDLACQGPDGTFFAGSASGTVYQISKTGVVTTFQTGLKTARGCAYDGAHKRLFVAEHDNVGTTNTIRIFPVN